MYEIKVSVIMTTMNCRSFLERSIFSYLRQTLKETELICIDGNSEDGTREYIEDMSLIDNRIKLVTEEGIGIGGAKNTGIKKASGEFITFLDADDHYVDERALSIMYSAAKSKNVKVCGAFRSLLFKDGHVENEPLHRLDCEGHPEGVLLRYRDRQYDYHFHSYIYDKKMLIDKDIKFAEALCYDDTHFFIRAMLCAGEFYVCPVELYRYCVGEPYKWGKKKTEDALAQFIDQLRISSENNLEMLHYITVMRMNYEYAENFVRNIREGDVNALKLLIEANNSLDSEAITTARHEEFPPDYLETMLHRKKEDCQVDCIYYDDTSFYILKPLLEIMSGAEDNRLMQLEKEVSDTKWWNDHIKNSLSYRIGMAITYVPRKIRRVLRKTRKA